MYLKMLAFRNKSLKTMHLLDNTMCCLNYLHLGPQIMIISISS